MRYGENKKEIQDSAAAHSWRATMMGYTIADGLDLDIDKNHAIKLLLVHDLSEYLYEYDVDSVLVARGAVSEEDKLKDEEKVMRDIKEKYSFGKKLYDLWEEFETRSTREAKYAKVIDKLEAQTHLLSKWESILMNLNIAFIMQINQLKNFLS